VTLNGRPHPRAVLTQDEILAGGELVFELGPAASRWGKDEADRPHTAVAGVAVTPAPVAEGPALVEGTATLKLLAAQPGDVIRYTLDGHAPDERSPRYGGPLTVRAPATVTFRAYRDGVPESGGGGARRKLDPRRRVRLASKPNPQYLAGGDQALSDGLRGGTDFAWAAGRASPASSSRPSLDLGRVQPLHHVSTGFLHDQASWIFLPLEVSYEVSTDGKTWRQAGTVAGDVDPHQERAARRELGVAVSGQARFVRVKTRSLLKVPPWHPGAGGTAHLFADEIVVE
jgi:hypothetical protein